MLHFNITKDSANVQDVTERAREGFAESTLVLVQANGLRIEDNEVTRDNIPTVSAFYINVILFILALKNH